jgi:Reverse transcriptase (RNA-dependent DNA polymerase)
MTKMNTVRILLSIAVNQRWKLYQMNVRNTFLQETLEDKFYMLLPPGYEKEEGTNVTCKLIKLIYGLKQSSRA